MEVSLSPKGELALSTTDFLTWIEKHSPKDVIQLGRHMQYGRQNKYVTVKFEPKEYQNGIELIHLTDVHYGHVCCHENRLRDYIDWILDVPNRFVLLGGDLVDAATKLSVGSPYENKWEPNEQCWKFCELFLRVRHRVLGYVGGNHERRSNQAFGSLGLLIATLLRVPFSLGKQYIDIQYGKWNPFKVSMWHGRGAARKKGARVMMLDDYMKEGDSHVYFVGHLHDCFVLPSWRLIRKYNTIKKEKYWGIMSSSFLDDVNGYAEEAGYSPTDTMMGRVLIEPDGHCGVTLR